MNAVSRTLLGSGILAIAAGGAMILAMKDRDRRSTQEEDKEKEKRAFGEVAVDAITHVELTYQGSRVVADKDGTDWKITEPRAALGDDATFAGVASAMANLALRTRLADGELDPAAVDLEKPAHVVVARTREGRTLQLHVGRKSPFNESFYVRAGEDARKAPVALVDGYALYGMQKSFQDLREKRLVRLGATDVESLEVTFAAPAEDAVSFSARRRTQAGGPRWDDGWDLVTPLAAPADRDEVGRVIQTLSAARALSFVEDEGDGGVDHARYGVDKPALTLVVTGKGTTTRLHIGTVPNGSATRYYLRRDDGAEVAEIAESTFTAVRRSLFTWRDKRLADFDRDRVATVRAALPEGAGTLVLKKTSGADAASETWQVVEPAPGGNARAWKVSSLLYALSNFKVEAWEKEGLSAPVTAEVLATWGLDKPTREVTLLDAAGATVAQVRVSEHDGKIYAYNQGGTVVGRVERKRLEDLPRAVDDFLDRPADADAGSR